MKTFISVPDSLFDVAEELARRTGLTRSELYTRALAEYVEERCGAWAAEQAGGVCQEMAVPSET